MFDEKHRSHTTLTEELNNLVAAGHRGADQLANEILGTFTLGAGPAQGVIEENRVGAS